MEANPHSILLVQSPPISAGCCAKRRSGDHAEANRETGTDGAGG